MVGLAGLVARPNPLPPYAYEFTLSVGPGGVTAVGIHLDPAAPEAGLDEIRRSPNDDGSSSSQLEVGSAVLEVASKPHRGCKESEPHSRSSRANCDGSGGPIAARYARTAALKPWGEHVPARIDSDAVAHVRARRDTNGGNTIVWGSISVMRSLLAAEEVVDELELFEKSASVRQ